MGEYAEGHISKELALRYVDGRMGGVEQSLADVHLGSCSDCSDLVGRARDFNRVWNGWTAVEHGRVLRRYAELTGGNEPTSEELTERAELDAIHAALSDAADILVHDHLASPNPDVRAEGLTQLRRIRVYAKTLLPGEPEILSSFEQSVCANIRALPPGERAVAEVSYRNA